MMVQTEQGEWVESFPFFSSTHQDPPSAWDILSLCNSAVKPDAILPAGNANSPTPKTAIPLLSAFPIKPQISVYGFFLYGGGPIANLKEKRGTILYNYASILRVARYAKGREND
jgi:hypothetical protein